MRALSALVAGLILPFSFAPYGLWICAPLALGLLFYCLEATAPRAAAWRGYCFGVGMFGHGISWIQVSIHKFGLPLYSFSVSMTALFVLFMALYPALAALLLRRLPAQSERSRLLFGAPAIWVLSELVRGSFLSGFPWLVVGYGQLGSWFAGYTPVAGAYGTSLAVALVAAAATGIAMRRVSLPPVGSRLALPILVLVPVIGYLLTRIEWTASLGEPLSVALVQGAIPQEVKWQGDARQPTLDLYAKLSAPHWGKSVVVWPEAALPAFPQEIAPFLRETAAQARVAGTAFLVGMPTGDIRGQYFNSLLLLGVAEGRYDKHHLVPFGEYLPLNDQIRPLLNFLAIPMSSFTAGADHQAALDAGHFKLGASICYEDAYGSEVRKPLPAANVLVNVSDDAWFGDSLAPHQHLEIAQVRALETGRPMLRATNTGISAIIDHRGNILNRSPQFVPYVLAGTVDARTGATPYVRAGEWPVLALSVLMLLVACRRGSAAKT